MIHDVDNSIGLRGASAVAAAIQMSKTLTSIKINSKYINNRRNSRD